MKTKEFTVGIRHHQNSSGMQTKKIKLHIATTLVLLSFSIYNLLPRNSIANTKHNFDPIEMSVISDEKGKIKHKFDHEAMPVISYEKVDEREGDYVRYAAFLKESSSSSSGNNNESKKALPVLKWAEIMSQNEKTQSKNNVAMELTNIIKVS